jgi:hypothetical protein
MTALKIWKLPLKISSIGARTSYNPRIGPNHRTPHPATRPMRQLPTGTEQPIWTTSKNMLIHPGLLPPSATIAASNAPVIVAAPTPIPPPMIE